MSLDKWLEYVHIPPKTPYVDREKYLDDLTEITFETKRNMFYVNVKCKCLRRNIHKDNVCVISCVVDPDCINCSYVREFSKVRKRFNRLKDKAKMWFYGYSVIEI